VMYFLGYLCAFYMYIFYICVFDVTTCIFIQYIIIYWDTCVYVTFVHFNDTCVFIQCVFHRIHLYFMGCMCAFYICTFYISGLNVIHIYISWDTCVFIHRMMQIGRFYST